MTCWAKVTSLLSKALAQWMRSFSMHDPSNVLRQPRRSAPEMEPCGEVKMLGFCMESEGEVDDVDLLSSDFMMV